MKNIIVSSMFAIVCINLLNAQIIANFEDGAATIQKYSLVDTLGLLKAEIISNPVKDYRNTSDSVVVIERAPYSSMWDGTAIIHFDTTQNIGDDKYLFLKAYVDERCRAYIRIFNDDIQLMECWADRSDEPDSFLIDPFQWLTLMIDLTDFDSLDFNEVTIQFGDWTGVEDFNMDVKAYIDDIELDKYLIIIPPIQKPQPEICMVTVDETIKKNMAIWKIPDNTSGIDSVLVNKEVTAGNFQQIGSVAYNDKNYFIDNESNPAQKSESYTIAFKDSAGNLTEFSQPHGTIHLMMSYGIGGAINLAWNYYYGFYYNAFNIYRGSSSEDLELLSTISSSVLSYTDLAPPSGDLYYVISVTNPDGCEVPTMKKSAQEVYSSTRSNFVSNVVTGQRDIVAGDDISIMPNPASGKIRIESDGNAGELGIEIVTIDGKSQIKQRVANGSEMDVSSLKSGMYFVIIEIENSRSTKRLVIQ
jgi:hypothetical protein